MIKILAVGCSYTKGHGLSGEKSDPRLWVNQLCNRIWHNPNINNASKSGQDNHWIFTRTSELLIADDYDYVIVAWTYPMRWSMPVGLELYNTCTRFENRDIHINSNQIIKGKWLEDLGNKLLRIRNEHWSILDIVRYQNILLNLRSNAKIFFVNTACNWSNNYFVEKSFEYPTELSDFEQDLLSVDFRDDKEIQKLYKMMHAQYREAGGIHNDRWLNLYDNLLSHQLDFASDTDRHPGYLSQDLYTDILYSSLKEKIQ